MTTDAFEKAKADGFHIYSLDIITGETIMLSVDNVVRIEPVSVAGLSGWTNWFSVEIGYPRERSMLINPVHVVSVMYI